jgi:hypothetical protein
MRWAGHMACMRDRRGAYRVFVQKPKEKRDHLEYLGVNGRIILKCIFNK